MTGPGRSVPARTTWILSIGLGLGVVGFVGYAQWNGSLAREEFRTSAQQVLSEEVLALEAEQGELRAEIEDADVEVQRFQEEATTSSAVLGELNTQLGAARLASGLTQVRGPGVIVEIADSQRVVPAGENPANFIVLVDDLRDIVTALWASGAEAIAINGERLVATSSVYGVGSSVLVNTAFLPPPFRIEAIGSEGLRDRFLDHEAFRSRVGRRIEVFGLEFATEATDEVTLPAFVGNTRFRWAVPAEEGG